MGWDKDVRDLCQTHNIVYQGFSLLTANREVLQDRGIGNIAQRFKTSSLQIIFRFAQQIGMLPLTGTTNKQHMKEDLLAERYELSSEEVKFIELIAM
jgi:diketogulonate reductase-like aldo/keto reductase